MENQKVDVVKNFAPSWFAVPIGTGIIPLALSLNKNIVPAFNVTAQVFFFINLALFVAILIPWLLKFFLYFKSIKMELAHPVLGSFYPTFSISVMLLALNFNVLGKTFFGETVSWNITTVLFVVGCIFTLLFGLVIFPLAFISNKTQLAHGNFGWLIPVISHLFIPLVGLDLMGHYKGTTAALGIFIASMVGFGIGFILFIYIGTAVYHRYIYHEVLMPKLAATLFIGLAPPALTTTICVKMITAVTTINYFGNTETIVALSKLAGLITWGFAIWWYVFASIVILYHIFSKKLPYALSWWAFTFPTGALAVSTGSINKLLKLSFFDYTLTGMIVIMLSIWLIVVLRTFKGVVDKSVFQG